MNVVDSKLKYKISLMFFWKDNHNSRPKNIQHYSLFLYKCYHPISRPTTVVQMLYTTHCDLSITCGLLCQVYESTRVACCLEQTNRVAFIQPHLCLKNVLNKLVSAQLSPTTRLKWDCIIITVTVCAVRRPQRQRAASVTFCALCGANHFSLYDAGLNSSSLWTQSLVVN